MVNGQKVSTLTLGDLISQGNASVQTGPFGTVLSASEFVRRGNPVISVREIKQGYIELHPDTPCVDEETYDRLRQYNLKPNDIVFARKGSVERSALIPDDGTDYFLGSDGICLRFLSPVVARYVLYALQSPEARSYLIRSSYGTTMAGLNEAIIAGVPISAPLSEREAQQITDALSNADSLIARTNELLKKWRCLREGVACELLYQRRRLPGFGDEWRSCRLGDVASFVSGGTPTKSNPSFWDGTIPWISSSDLMLGDINTIDCTHWITQSAIEKSATMLCEGPTIHVVVRVGIGKVALSNGGICTSQDYCNLVQVTQDEAFLAYLLSYSMRDLSRKAQGTSIQGVTLDDLKALRLRLPCIEEQRAIAQAISQIDLNIKLLQQKLDKYRQIRQGMMRELLTGHIRLVQG